MNSETAVHLVEDDAAVRMSTKWVLEAAGMKVMTYESADDFLAEGVTHSQGCLILDLQMPGKSGLYLLDDLRRQGDFSMPVLVVSGTADVSTAVMTMKLGASDFLTKPVDPGILVQKVRETLADDEVKRKQKSLRSGIRHRMNELTVREREILSLICNGFSNKQIGGKLGISTKTTANHRASIIAKLKAINTADLVKQVVLSELN